MDVEKPRGLKRRKNGRGQREMVWGIRRMVILTDSLPASTPSSDWCSVCTDLLVERILSKNLWDTT